MLHVSKRDPGSNFSPSRKSATLTQVAIAALLLSQVGQAAPYSPSMLIPRNGIPFRSGLHLRVATTMDYLCRVCREGPVKALCFCQKIIP